MDLGPEDPHDPHWWQARYVHERIIAKLDELERRLEKVERRVAFALGVIATVIILANIAAFLGRLAIDVLHLVP